MFELDLGGWQASIDVPFNLIAEMSAIASSGGSGSTQDFAERPDWLPFLDTYRTMCRAPEPAFRRILEDVRELRFDA